MTEPTTEDTAGSTWPAVLPPLPAAGDVPREGAVDTNAMAGSLLATALYYRDAIRGALESDPPVVDRDALDQAAEFRRGVAVVADLIVRRALSPTGVSIAQRAARVAERVAGLTVAAGQQAGIVHTTAAFRGPTRLRIRDILGDAADRCQQMGGPDDDTFEAAIQMCVNKGSVTYDAMIAALAAGGLTDAAEEQRAIMTRLAAGGNSSQQIGAVLDVTAERAAELARRYGIPVRADQVSTVAPVPDPARVVRDVVRLMDDVSSTAQELGRIDVAVLDRDACADWTRNLWESTKYVLLLRQMLDDHARGQARA